jgi:hypothetical protein
MIVLYQNIGIDLYFMNQVSDWDLINFWKSYSIFKSVNESHFIPFLTKKFDLKSGKHAKITKLVLNDGDFLKEW